MVLELLMLATRTTWTPMMMSLPTDKLHVSRHVRGEPLTRMLACDIRLFLGYSLAGCGITPETLA